jgi:putative Mn2+ efflux pump MntP
MNYRTTISGIVMGIASLLQAFGVGIPAGVLEVIIGLGAFAMGYFAKDAANKPV